MSDNQGKKEICFIMPSLCGGGAERVASVLCNYFVDHGHKVSIFLVNQDVIDYSLDSRIYVDKSLINNTKGINRILKRLFGIRRILRMKPDATFISFLSMYSLYTLAASFGMKRDIIVSERLDPRKSIPNKKILFQARNYLYSKAKNVVFQTPDAKAFFPDQIQDKGVIIANPLKEDLPASYQGQRKKVVATFARLEPQKNYPLLICAFEEFLKYHSDYTLSIYGKGTMEESLKELVSSKHLDKEIMFKGFCSDVHGAIRDAAMFVLPSDYEGLSNSMLEAMAIGLPVICTDCPPGGARMFITSGENGLLTPVGDEEAMCKAMCYMAENPDLAQKMGIRASEVRKKLSVENICSQWETLL